MVADVFFMSRFFKIFTFFDFFHFSPFFPILPLSFLASATFFTFFDFFLNHPYQSLCQATCEPTEQYNFLSTETFLQEYFLKSNVLINFDLLKNHGCWCTELANYKPFRGVPIDQIDTICRSWHTCRRCARDSCDVDFAGGFDIFHAKKSWTCNGESDCNKFQCECDLQFAESLIEELTDESLGNLHQVTTGDECVVQTRSLEKQELGCCGHGANASWTLYNTETFTCDLHGAGLHECKTLCDGGNLETIFI